MSLTSEPTLRLAMLVFAGVCVVWGVARGIGRLVMMAASVFVGAAAGWAFFRYAPGPLISWLNGFHGEAVQWGAGVCGVLGFWFSQRFLGSLFNGPGTAPSGAGPRTRAGIFSLVPALLILWGGAMAVRYSGGVARMRWVEQAALDNRAGELKEPPLLAQLRQGVSSGTLGQVLDKVDPFHSREASALGALLALRRNETAWQNLLRQPRMAPLVQSVVLRPLLKDNEVLHALSFSHYSKLLTLPELTEAVTSPAIRDTLRSFPVEDAIRAAIAGTPALPQAPRAEVVE
jgi:hypothetical protein